jgi:hypothetical protein
MEPEEPHHALRRGRDAPKASRPFWGLACCAPRVLPPTHDHPEFPKGSEVRDLLDAKDWAVQALRERVKSHRLYDAAKHDDFSLLRFLLSHHDRVAASAHAFTSALEWREEHSLDEIAKRLRSGLRQCDFPGFERIHPHNPWYIYTSPTDGGVVVINAIAQSNFKRLMDSTTVAEFSAYQFHVTELSMMLCDRASRASGRLVKQTKIVDVAGAAMSQLDMRFINAVSASSKSAENSYPQLSGSLLICNAGTGVRFLFDHIAMPLMPVRLRSKVVMVEPLHRADDRDRLLSLLPADELPDRVGGRRKLSTDTDKDLVDKGFVQLGGTMANEEVDVRGGRRLGCR